MALELLTSVARVKLWLSSTSPPTGDDPALAMLVAGVSRFVLNNLNRDFLTSRRVTERVDGQGRCRQMLRNWPVTNFYSLSIDNIAIAQSQPAGQGAGWWVDYWDGNGFGQMTAVDLFGYAFTRGRGNVVQSYQVGYQRSEDWAIPASPFQVTLDAPDGPWASDLGVVFDSNGAALTAVTGVPITGQYAVDSIGRYTFAAADTGKSVTILYGFVPADIETACFELVGEQFRYRQRIGETSKRIGGETVSFDRRAMTAFVDALLQPHRRVVTP